MCAYTARQFAWILLCLHGRLPLPWIFPTPAVRCGTRHWLNAKQKSATERWSFAHTKLRQIYGPQWQMVTHITHESLPIDQASFVWLTALKHFEKYKPEWVTGTIACCTHTMGLPRRHSLYSNSTKHIIVQKKYLAALASNSAIIAVSYERWYILCALTVGLQLQPSAKMCAQNNSETIARKWSYKYYNSFSLCLCLSLCSRRLRQFQLRLWHICNIKDEQKLMPIVVFVFFSMPSLIALRNEHIFFSHFCLTTIEPIFLFTNTRRNAQQKTIRIENDSPVFTASLRFRFSWDLTIIIIDKKTKAVPCALACIFGTMRWIKRQITRHFFQRYFTLIGPPSNMSMLLMAHQFRATGWLEHH